MLSNDIVDRAAPSDGQATCEVPDCFRPKKQNRIGDKSELSELQFSSIQRGFHLATLYRVIFNGTCQDPSWPAALEGLDGT